MTTTDLTPRTTVKQFLHRARMAYNPDWQLELYEGTTYKETGTAWQHLVLCRAGSHGNDPLGRVTLDGQSEHVIGFAPVDRLPYGVAIKLIALAEGAPR
jgi:hypothetical protein